MISNHVTQPYFPIHVKIFGLVCIVFGISCLFFLWIISLFAIPVGIFILTTQYRLMVDMEKKQYMDYLLIFGFKSGVQKPFTHIEKIYLTSGYVTMELGSRGGGSLIRKYEFNAFIVFVNHFSEYNKIHLISSTDKREVMDLVKIIAKDLSLVVHDLSEELQ